MNTNEESKVMADRVSKRLAKQDMDNAVEAMEIMEQIYTENLESIMEALIALSFANKDVRSMVAASANEWLELL